MTTGSRPTGTCFVVLAALLGLPAAASTAAPSIEGAATCPAYGDPAKRGRVPAALEELSGLAASRVHDDLYWAHNDSGNAFELFAIDESGEIRAKFPLRGAEPRDIEDVAVGPCERGSSGTCVYLGDFGDNRYRRPEARIYRLREPEQLDGAPLDVDVLRFRWPDGPRNAEAMVVEPGTGRIFVWTKEPRSLGVVHRIDGLEDGGVARAVVVREVLPVFPADGLPTGADVHPSGERLLIRTYARTWELRRDGATRLEETLAARPVLVPGASQRQSEAVAYTHDGRSYLLGTEGTGGPLYEVGCVDDPPDPVLKD